MQKNEKEELQPPTHSKMEEKEKHQGQQPSLQYIAPWNLQYREPCQTSFLCSSQRPPFLGNQRPSLKHIAPSQTSFAYSSQRPPFLTYRQSSLQHIAPSRTRFAYSIQKLPFIGYQHQNLNPATSMNNLNHGNGGHAEPGINSIEGLEIDTEKIVRGEDTRTCLMIRNIPNRTYTYTQRMDALVEAHQKNPNSKTMNMQFRPTLFLPEDHTRCGGG
ncbi:hypothetical protein TSUD_101390 [Trifolium subterraneum]|uniref:Mei2-like C-terminal RNA recognition motif domain-containing protein n=1 Tax=Trifolium subterraneum TaxID=3900 RepID=A0A2Z6MKE4_TRISU|nr:hypothetical protein TSUD_101390 [Trifolium subterraneum]